MLVYASIAITALAARVLARTRIGLVIRATGDNHHSAHALGYNVIAVRYACIAFGGACAGLAGGYLSLAYTPQWIENMTAGRGWIALALVVFATWAPRRVAVGAYLFGTVWIMGLYAQGIGIDVPPQLLASLPYLVTIAALVLISGNRILTKVNTPACHRPALRAGSLTRAGLPAGAMAAHHLNERQLRGRRFVERLAVRRNGHAPRTNADNAAIVLPALWTAPEAGPERIRD